MEKLLATFFKKYLQKTIYESVPGKSRASVSEFILTLDFQFAIYPFVSRSVMTDRLPSGEDGVWGRAPT
jgi:hypothetical protein